jgi:hypothetical protein
LEGSVLSQLVEVRILPPLAIGRLGSSPEPMDNYDLVVANPVGAREIRPADTLIVDPMTGDVSLKRPPFDVKFRDADGNIRPVSPFLEVWARTAGATTLEPLTLDLLSSCGLDPSAIGWNAHVANRKAFRRTGDPGDAVHAETGWFSDHTRHALTGSCANFLAGAAITYGHVQWVRPNATCPEVRLRFTPAGGKVYGPPPDAAWPPLHLDGVVYDTSKGTWKGYTEPSDPTKDPIAFRRLTNPQEVFYGQMQNGNWVSAGLFDDECDGIVEVRVETPAGPLTAFARISAGPPTFAPDSLPVRTVADELEQALLGPAVAAPLTPGDAEAVAEIVRRALETVRLMNTAQMNKASPDPGVGMARDDHTNWGRALEPIVEPALADALAIRARHERVLLALESGALAWFARVLRRYDQVGDLSPAARRLMPALMRGPDGNHLALTRRQVAKVQTAADPLARNDDGGQQ